MRLCEEELKTRGLTHTILNDAPCNKPIYQSSKIIFIFIFILWTKITFDVCMCMCMCGKCTYKLAGCSKKLSESEKNDLIICSFFIVVIFNSLRIDLILERHLIVF